MPLVRITVPPNPARLLHAIASIGYDVEVALCDIIDNSFDADCRNIEVSVAPVLLAEGGETDTIAHYLIADDGVGMSPDELKNALKIGSDRVYEGDSLGKFGIGLKSAALALGNKLTVISKNSSMVVPVCAVLSASAIMQQNEYCIEFGEIEGDTLDLWRRNAPNHDHGTIVIVSELNDSAPAQSHFSEFLKRYCSITYHLLMADSDGVAIKVNGQPLLPIDPLFPDEADKNGKLIPNSWSGKTVQRLLAPTKIEYTASIFGTVEATQLIHPPSFEGEGQRVDMRDRYMVDRDPYTAMPRHGFYVYRNRRVIVMAERFRGIVPSQTSSWAFRGRLMFNEGADEVLKLDVKKRHCTLPRKARHNLMSLVRSYVSLSAEAWRQAGRIETKRRGEQRETAANESISDSAPSKLSYTSGMNPDSHETAQQRSLMLEAMSRSSDSSIQDETLTTERLTELVNKRNPVILANGIRGNVMWMPKPAPEVDTATVFVNRNNTWVENAYAAADENSELFVTLHQLFFILSRAEIELRSNRFTEFNQEVAGKVLDTFRRRAGSIAEDLAERLEEIYSAISEGHLDDEEE